LNHSSGNQKSWGGAGTGRGRRTIRELSIGACASQPAGAAGTPAFWSGLWHGIVAPIAFIVSLFNDDVRMYAYPNAGRWYDFGFLIGISAWGGGAAASR
jgi:hypothetical protein